MPRSLLSLALFHAVLCAPDDGGTGAAAGGAPAPAPPAAAHPAPAPAPPPAASPIGAVELDALRAKAQQADQLAARVKELEGYEPDAKAYRATVTEELKAIETEKATLSPAAQAALDATPTLAGKKAVLAALRGAAPAATTPGKTVHTPSPASGAPAPNTPVDFDAAFRSGIKALDEAKAKDPTGFAAWEARVLGGGRPASSLDTIFAPKKR